MLPNDIQFPGDINQLSAQLENIYRDLIIGINGDIRQWNPTLYGTSTAGATTYVHRSCWSWRRGLLVQLWLDIEWSAASGTGGIGIELPYKVAKSDNQPFVGFVENTGGLDFTNGYTYLTWRAEPDSFDSAIRESGDGVSSQELAIANSGRLTGYITYIGQEYQ